jgi:hypothetical protein
MLTVSRSRRPDRTDIAVALAVAALGAAALLAPDALQRVAPPCLFTLLLDRHCWGCGMTRASLAFLHGDVVAAWHLNRSSVLVLPMLMVLYARHVLMILRGLQARQVP